MILGLLGLLGLVLVVVGWNATRLWLAWRNVERFEFNPEAVRQELAEPPAGGEEAAPPEGAPDTTATSLSVPGDAFDVYLAVGSDESPRKDSVRSDAIVLFLLPRGGEDPLLLSMPRDLAVPDPCAGGTERLSFMLEGCEDVATGPELLTVAIEDFTGLHVTHFVIFGFDGFRKAIDRLDGIPVCVENPVRTRAGGPLLLDAGCTVVDGDTALTWLRGRTLQERVDGEWQAVAQLGDAGRIARQQDFLLELLRRLKAFVSITSLSAIVEDLSDAFILDDDLSLGRAVSLLWELRSLRPQEIRRRIFPASPVTTTGGEFLLMPDMSFAEVLLEEYPELAAPP